MNNSRTRLLERIYFALLDQFGDLDSIHVIVNQYNATSVGEPPIAADDFKWLLELERQRNALGGLLDRLGADLERLQEAG